MILRLHSTTTLTRRVIVDTDAIIALTEVLVDWPSGGKRVYGTEIYLEGGKTLTVLESIETLATHISSK